MRAVLCLCVCFPALLAAQAYGVSVAPMEVQLTQADTGESIWAVPRGSERGSWMETRDGYTIVESNGVWSYALQDQTGNLVSSGLRADEPLPLLTRGLWPKNLHPPLSEGPERTLLPIERDSEARVLSGTQPLLVILVNFTDISFTYTDASFRSMVFGATNSVKDFYRENTYGNFTIVPANETYGTANDGVVHVTSALPHPNSGTDWETFRTFVGEYITAADQFVNFAAYDVDADLILETRELSILIVLAGYDNSYGGAAALTPRIWAHQWSTLPELMLDGRAVSPYAVVGERHGVNASDTHQSTIGVMCHELGHLMFGLPDLYDADNSTEGVGEWCLMGTGNWNMASVEGDTPSHLSGWPKAMLGIVTSDDAHEDADGVVSLHAGYANQSITHIWLDPYRSPRGQRFLLENRQFGGYDAKIPGEGMLIWRVDGFEPNNNFELHPILRLDQADGLGDLWFKNNRGDAGDPFPGSTNNTLYNTTSNPSSRLPIGTSSGVTIEVTSDIGATVTANVELLTRPYGETTYYGNMGTSHRWGFDEWYVWTAVVYTNDTDMNRIDGIEAYLPSNEAVDIYLYEGMNGTIPTNLLYSESQRSLGGHRGWGRILLSTPQPFPPGSTRVVVLRIYNIPQIRYANGDILGTSSGRSFIDADGVGAFQPIAGDLAQALSLGRTPSDMIFVDFDYTFTEFGTQLRPYNSFAEALMGVRDGGVIQIRGDSVRRSSNWTGTLDRPLTINVLPKRLIRIGVNGAPTN